MLSFFKSNNPGVVIFYFLYILLFRICFFFIAPDIFFFAQHQEPLSRLLFGFLEKIPTNYLILNLSLASLLCFIQALLINGIVSENRILAKKNYLAGILFIILSSFFKGGLFLSPALIALTFLILSVSRLFSILKKEKPYTDIFDAAFLVAVAALFYFPSILLIIGVYIGLATLRPFSYREWIIAFLGFCVPFILTFTFYFWNDELTVLLQNLSNFSEQGWLLGNLPSPAEWVMIGGILLVSLACLVLLPSVLYSSLIQVRKFSTILTVLVFLTAASFFLQQTVSLSHLVLLSLPVSVLFAMVLMQVKQKVVSEVIHIILILLVLAGQLIPLFNIL